MTASSAAGALFAPANMKFSRLTMGSATTTHALLRNQALRDANQSTPRRSPPCDAKRFCPTFHDVFLGSAQGPTWPVFSTCKPNLAHSPDLESKVVAPSQETAPRPTSDPSQAKSPRGPRQSKSANWFLGRSGITSRMESSYSESSSLPKESWLHTADTMMHC